MLSNNNVSGLNAINVDHYSNATVPIKISPTQDGMKLISPSGLESKVDSPTVFYEANEYKGDANMETNRTLNSTNVPPQKPKSPPQKPKSPPQKPKSPPSKPKSAPPPPKKQLKSPPPKLMQGIELNMTKVKPFYKQQPYNGSYDEDDKKISSSWSSKMPRIIAAITLLFLASSVIYAAVKHKNFNKNKKSIHKSYYYGFIPVGFACILSMYGYYEKKISFLTLCSICFSVIGSSIFIIFKLIDEGKGVDTLETICPSGNSAIGVCQCVGTLSQVQTCLETTKNMCNNNDNRDKICACPSGKGSEHNCFETTGLFEDRDKIVRLLEGSNFITYYYAHEKTPDNRQDYIMSLPAYETYPGQLWKQIVMDDGSFVLKNMLFKDKYLFMDSSKRANINFELNTKMASKFKALSDGSVFLLQDNKQQKALQVDGNGELMWSSNSPLSFIKLQVCDSGVLDCKK